MLTVQIFKLTQTIDANMNHLKGYVTFIHNKIRHLYGSCTDVYNLIHQNNKNLQISEKWCKKLLVVRVTIMAEPINHIKIDPENLELQVQ
jgi:hypothetical protein